MAQQTLTGNAMTLGAVASGGTVSCSPSEYPQVIGGSLLAVAVITAVISPSTGNFTISVTKGARLRIICKDGNSKIFLNTVIHISDDDAMDISSYLYPNTIPTGGVGSFVASVNGRSGVVTLGVSDVPAHMITHLPIGSDPLTTNFFHGVVSRATVSPLPTSISTTTFTLACATTPLTYYYKGEVVTINTDKTCTVTTGKNFIYFTDITGDLTASSSFPDLFTTVLVATVTWNGTNLGVVSDERHNHTRDIDWHLSTHEGIGTRYISGITFSYAGVTNTNTTFATTSGQVNDEDIKFVINAQTTGRIWYQTSANVYAMINTLSTKPYWGGATAGTGIYAINATTFAQLTITSSTNFFNYFVYASTDVLNPIYILAESTTVTAGHTSAANARLISPPQIGVTNLTTELKLLYRIVVNGAGLVQTPIAADDYRSGGSIAGGGTTTVSHNSLSNLGFASAPVTYGHINTTDLLTKNYADNTAALSGGLVSGDLYRTSTGVVMIVY